uniref:EGF-like domain-containing protein n=1 Tax=Haemonchus placei TaxID=6290 RepID=A0A0N4VVZ5_HAEPC
LECPKGSLPFDLDECDPNRRSQCPSGFTCRYTSSCIDSVLNLIQVANSNCKYSFLL